jgi:hypothetical protein
MKKFILMLIMILSICLLFAGCGSGDGGNGEEASQESTAGIPESGAEALAGLGIEDLSGSYAGTMTMTKVGVVYDSEDMDEDGNILHYYKPEGTSEWEGESVDVTFEVALEGDEVNVLNGEGETAFNVTYDPLTGTWENSKDVPPGTEITAAEFSKVDGKAHIKIVFTSTYENTEVPDGVNEIVIEITKAD